MTPQRAIDWSFAPPKPSLLMTALALISVVMLILLYAVEREERVRMQDTIERVKLWSDCRPPREDERIIITREYHLKNKALWRYQCTYVSVLRDPDGYLKKRARLIQM